VLYLIPWYPRRPSNLSCVVDPSGEGIVAAQGPEIGKLLPIPKKRVNELVTLAAVVHKNRPGIRSSHRSQITHLAMLPQGPTGLG
jgi:hypothetical protein